MLNCSGKKSADYISPEMEIIDFYYDVITSSGTQGGADGKGDGTDIDHSGWT